MKIRGNPECQRPHVISVFRLVEFCDLGLGDAQSIQSFFKPPLAIGKIGSDPIPGGLEIGVKHPDVNIGPGPFA